MKLMVVESPNKVKKIEGFLGEGWRVMASVGHVRDLPEDELGVDEETFQPSYVFIPPRKSPGRDKPFPGGKERVARIAKVASTADVVYLATDPDREGEAIAWHLKEALHLRNPERVTFGEITAKAVKASLSVSRKLDMDLVRAQEARRVLDRLYGYKVSRAVSNQSGTWRTAGRVQSPAVRLVVERERAIRNFKPVTHYGAELAFAGDWSAKWRIKPHLAEGQALWLDADQAANIAAIRDVTVAEFADSEKRQGPPAPFTTSTMQQAASVAAKLRPKAAMDAAQKLFEQGAITYHRTDDPNLADDAFDDLEAFAKAQGMDVHAPRRRWKAKAGSQESHEAIRPTHIEVEDAGDDDAQRALYRLIRARTLAAVLPDAVYAVRAVVLDTTESLDGEPVRFEATGRTLKAPGWRSVYADAKEDDEDGEDAANPIPELAQGQALTADSGRVLTHKTKAPARFTEASLVRDMEKRGIGRPSTYAAIMENIVHRGYISVDGKRKLHAEESGESLIDALAGAFAFVDLDFTANLENQLDEVAQGQRTYQDVVTVAATQLSGELGELRESLPPAHPCPTCGKAMRRRAGKNGAFWGCTGYPECRTTLPDDNGKPGERKAPPVSDEYQCTKCGKPLVHRVKKGKGGYDFWGCSGYPKCKQSYESNSHGKPRLEGKK